MDRPPARLLQKRLKCAVGVTEAAAVDACEDAIRESGFTIATRSERCLVLMPCPSTSWRRCLAPGQANLPSQEPSAGRGVTVEFVPEGAEGGRLVVCVAAARAGKGKAFLDELRCRLKVAAHRAKLAGGHDVVEEQESCEKGPLRDPTVYYHVSRLLCSRRTAVGEETATFLDDFVRRYGRGSLGEQALPRADGQRAAPMVECGAAVSQLCQAVQDTWGNAATTEAVGPAPSAPSQPRLRACVERCIFTRLGPTLWNVYSGWYEAEDARFAQRAASLRTLGDTSLLKALEVREVLHGITAAVCPRAKGDLVSEDAVTEATRSTAAGSEDESQGVNQDVSEEAADSCADEHLGGTHGCSSKGSGAPAVGRSVYRRAAAALSRVQDLVAAGHSGTPREAVEALALAQLETRMCALEASGGQFELTSMEEILPVFTFVLVRSSLARPLACARLLADALLPEEKLNSEGKAVQLLESAARSVASECDRGLPDAL